MIAASTSTGQHDRDLPRQRWQQAMADAVASPAELCALLGLDPSIAAPGSANFPLRVPRGFVARMRHGDPRDPLLLQVLPTHAESIQAPGFLSDPVGDQASRAGAGVLHKYAGRALLIATGACAIHCRYCFRRHFPYAEDSALADGWRGAIDYLQSDPTISEVILSGGDPLSLSDRRLAQLTDALLRVPHIRRLRIHTRQPIVLPERVDAGLLKWLSDLPLQKVMVVHANHANEIDQEVASACRELAARNVTLLNQSVLLAGVNDSVTALAQLSEALMAINVLPYYLHVLDRVQGAAHFEVDEATALQLHAGLLERLPGYLVPRLVREVPGAPSKTPVTLGSGGC
ncbi:EF-P beta-lysylation protein EpmB [Povalibacter sp.]|uniref:EF-P beta-lysylation protein EpmB n=1 Tax=Povalibacter sp. TaxID=1962978 RepID=UPI002F42BF11